MEDLIGNKPKLIMLDWDNTLANSWKIIHKCLNQAFVTFGHEPWSEEDVISGRDNIHHSLRQSFPKIFGEDKWEAAADVYYKHFRACHLDEIELLDGAEETIKILSQGDFKLSIVSNKTGQFLRDELKKLNIDQYFDDIIGAKDVSRDKPYPDQLLHVIVKHGLDPVKLSENIWMVGDSNTDIESAINAKVKPVIFGDGDVSRYENEHFSGKKISRIRDHNQFLELAKSIV